MQYPEEEVAVTESSRFPKSILNLVRVASLALLAATLVMAAKPQAARAEEWVQAALRCA